MPQITFQLPEAPVEDPQLLVLIDGKQAGVVMEPVEKDDVWMFYSLDGRTLLYHSPSLFRIGEVIKDRCQEKNWLAAWLDDER